MNFVAILVRWFDLYDEESVTRKRFRYLEERSWLDKQTEEVTFILAVLNNQIEPLVSETRFTFRFNRGNFCSVEDFLLFVVVCC
jgi:hypothetical protein